MSVLFRRLFKTVVFSKFLFTTEGFFEVAIQSWPECDLNTRPLNSVQTLKPTELSGHEFNSDIYTQIYIHVHICIYIDIIYI